MIKKYIPQRIKSFLKIFRMSYLRSLTFKIKLGHCGRNLSIGRAVTTFNPKMLYIGDNVIIDHHCSFHINPLHDKARLIIKDRVQLGKYNDFGCSNEIIIEEDVITAPFVHFTDRDHGYEDIDTPIMYQPAKSKGPIIIKKGVWLGFGVQIMSGVTVGEQSVVAAGSIVTKDVPPYSVVGGNPIKLLKQFNFTTKKWERVNTTI